jgi:pilus assembly protein Flp/PilA
MKNAILRLSAILKNLAREDGQDLVEYALIVALLAFCAAGTMKILAADINNAFAGIGSSLTSYVS